MQDLYDRKLFKSERSLQNYFLLKTDTEDNSTFKMCNIWFVTLEIHFYFFRGVGEGRKVEILQIIWVKQNIRKQLEKEL